MSVQSGSRRRRALVAAGFAALAAALGGSTTASEGRGDLNVQLRLVETEAGRRPAGAPQTGVARIEVSVDAYRATEAIQLAVERPDGSVWTFESKPFRPALPTWNGPRGERIETTASGPSIPARGLIRTTIAVPLERAAIHDVVVTVTGLAEGDALAGEGALRIAFGVPDGAPVDDGELANFTLQEVP